MKNNMETILRQFDTTIDQWISFLDNYTLEMICQQPQPGSWSLGQMYTHIINDTQYYVEQVRLTLASNENSELEMNAGGKNIFANNALPDMQLQGPATNTHIPQPESIAVLRQGLVAIRESVHQLAAGADLSAATGKTTHPGFGFFTALEWLRFGEIHMRHHFRQKERIDAQLSFGKSE